MENHTKGNKRIVKIRNYFQLPIVDEKFSKLLAVRIGIDKFNKTPIRIMKENCIKSP